MTTEDSSQTASQPTATVTTPAPDATPNLTAAATPAADNAPSNNPTTTATSETQPGTGWGVDTIQNEQDLERAIELLDDDDLPLETETPAAPAAAAVSTPAPAAAPPPPPAGEDGGDDLVVPGSRPKHYKLPIEDDVTFHALRLKKQATLGGTELSLGEAEVMAQRLLGKTPASPAAAPAPATTEAPAATAAPSTEAAPATELDAQLTDAYSQYETARGGFDEVAEAAALRLINDLNRQKTLEEMRQTQRVEQQEQQHAQVAQQQFQQDWESSVSQAARLYPDATNPQSVLAQKAAEIQDAYATSQDPAMQAIYNSATSPLFFFQQAAANLNLSPAQPGSAAPAPATVSTPPPVIGQRPPVSALLATHPGTTTPAALTFDPNTITNIHQLESLVDSMT